MGSSKRNGEIQCCGRSGCWAEIGTIRILQKSQVVLNMMGFWLYTWELKQLATVASLGAECELMQGNSILGIIDQVGVVICMISATASTSGILVVYFLVIQTKERQQKVFAWWATSSAISLIWEVVAVNFYNFPNPFISLHGRLTAAINGVAFVIARLHLCHHGINNITHC